MGKSSASKLNTGEIVLASIKKLTRNTGWTARTIIKFIKMEYPYFDSKLSRRVSRALKRGVKLGLLQVQRGRYRLNDMARLARPYLQKMRRCQNRVKRQNQRPLQIRSRSCASMSGRSYFS